jgi:hypothetical protein
VHDDSVDSSYGFPSGHSQLDHMCVVPDAVALGDARADADGAVAGRAVQRDAGAILGEGQRLQPID